MLLNIFPDNIIGYMLTYRSKEIPLLPKMSCPQMLPYLRKFLKDLATRNALQNPDHLRYRIPRRKRNQKMHMIFAYLAPINLKIKMLSYLLKNPLHPLLYRSSQHLLPILRTPGQMILGFIDRMSRPSQNHAAILGGKQPFLKPHRSLPMRQ